MAGRGQNQKPEVFGFQTNTTENYIFDAEYRQNQLQFAQNAPVIGGYGRGNRIPICNNGQNSQNSQNSYANQFCGFSAFNSNNENCNNTNNNCSNRGGKGGFDRPSCLENWKSKQYPTNIETEMVNTFGVVDSDEKFNTLGSVFDQNSIGGGFGSIDEQKKSSFNFENTMKEVRNIPLEDRFKDLKAITKNFYREHPEVTAMYPEEVEQLRRLKNDISSTDLSLDATRKTPNLLWKFEHAFENYPEIMDQISANNFDEPTPVQCQMWPLALSGYDVIGIAQTGTGKTLGFLLPAFIHIEGQTTPRSERTGPTVLVVTPTRELALQIEREVRKYQYKQIRSVCVYGGGSRSGQVYACASGVEIVIATPGRLNDLVQSSVVNLSSISYLVLDEADRMLDMGFEPQIRQFLCDIRPDRHTVLTSATWPPSVRELAKKYIKDGFLLVVGSLDLNACQNVTQHVRIVDEDQKRSILTDLIMKMSPSDKLLVFVGRKRIADNLASDLARYGIECETMHGDRDQLDREKALRDLRSGSIRILIATDVASRGLDVPDITHVFNYDFPKNTEEYVHRIGRTGRAGKLGQAITLMTRHDWRQSREIITILEKNNQEVSQDLRNMAMRFNSFLEKEQTQPRYGQNRDFGSRSNVRNFYDPFSGEKIGTFL